MKLSEQVITFEQSKSLQHLGVNTPSLYSHFTAPSHKGICLTEIYMRHIAILCGEYYDSKWVTLYPAYTVAEILKGLKMKVFSNVEYCGYQFECGRVTGHLQATTFGESAGKLLIALIEKGQITIDQFNENLNR